MDWYTWTLGRQISTILHWWYFSFQHWHSKESIPDAHPRWSEHSDNRRCKTWYPMEWRKWFTLPFSCSWDSMETSSTRSPTSCWIQFWWSWQDSANVENTSIYESHDWTASHSSISNTQRGDTIVCIRRHNCIDPAAYGHFGHCIHRTLPRSHSCSHILALCFEWSLVIQSWQTNVFSGWRSQQSTIDFPTFRQQFCNTDHHLAEQPPSSIDQNSLWIISEPGSSSHCASPIWTSLYLWDCLARGTDLCRFLPVVPTRYLVFQQWSNSSTDRRHEKSRRWCYNILENW